MYSIIVCRSLLGTFISFPTLNELKIIPRLASRKLEQELHQIWVSSI